MKTYSVKKAFALLLCAAALFSLCAIPAAAAGTPVVTGYTCSMPAVTKDSQPAITVHIKDTSVKTADVSADGTDTSNIDISRMVDSFAPTDIADLEIESALSDPLSFRFRLAAVYSGSGRALRFMLGYKNIPDSYSDLEITVRECVEYTEPSFEEEPWTIPMPVVQISRGEMNPILPGEDFTLSLTLTNTSKSTKLENPVVSFSPSSAFIIADSTASKMLPDIKHGETATVNLKLRALSSFDSPSQSVNVKLSFNYFAGDAGTVSGSASETVLIPVVTDGSPAAGAPLAVITRDDVSKVQANQEFTLNVNIQNLGSAAMDRPILSVSPDSSLAMMDATMSRLLNPIGPGETVKVPIRLKALDRISSPSLGVNLTLKNGTQTTEETVYIPAYVNADSPDAPTRIEGATPNVIISQYSYGDDAQIAAGSTFDLAMEFKNTSSLFTVENIVMTIGTGEGLTISSSSNTMFYPSLRAGDTQSETLAITALPTAKTGSAKIDVGFSYEYVDNQQRYKVSTTQNISIPIYQPDRFEVELPALPEYVSAYEELYISMPYVNKGKSEICNVRAELISPDGSVSAINPVQNLGNFASGSSGTIDFIFTPQMSGQVEFLIAVTYEDPNAMEKTVEFPISLSVEEPYYPEYDPSWEEPGWDEPAEENTGMPWWVWCIIGAVVVAAAVIVLLAVRRKKHPKEALLDDFVWQGDQSNTPGGKE